jgi:hypothetical protein
MHFREVILCLKDLFWLVCEYKIRKCKIEILQQFLLQKISTYVVETVMQKSEIY